MYCICRVGRQVWKEWLLFWPGCMCMHAYHMQRMLFIACTARACRNVMRISSPVAVAAACCDQLS